VARLVYGFGGSHPLSSEVGGSPDHVRRDRGGHEEEGADQDHPRYYPFITVIAEAKSSGIIPRKTALLAACNRT
jgi:hypothetical protein